MISITELWCGREGRSHKLRYEKMTDDIKPVVVWNSTRRCNLKCVHCYSSSHNYNYPKELTTAEALKNIDDLASFDSPYLLFSGGEPLMRDDLFILLEHAKAKGLKTAISTNGTLIDLSAAKRLKEAEVEYVGVSLDGIGKTNDKFRGVDGAFERTCKAFINLKEFRVRCGLRLTLTKMNMGVLTEIFNFVEENEIERVCFYHIVPVGRASPDMIPKPHEIRRALDSIILWAEELVSYNSNTEILTVDNHADSIYVYLKTLEKSPSPHGGEGNRILSLIRQNGGAKLSSGVGIACIDSKGDVHPDQFRQDSALGNIRERKFSEIWADESNKILADLRNRIPLLKGRCGRCKWKELCGGGLRSRAYATYGDYWAEDPGCYLSEDEIYCQEQP